MDLDKEIKTNIYSIEKIDYLNEKDKKILTNLFENIGQKDLESENTFLLQAEELLKLQKVEASEDKNKNMKLYEKLGMLVGVSIVITII